MKDVEKKVVVSEDATTPIKEYDSSMFELTNGQDVRIHDEALKTKPTTFAKDALKRFAKNKSSVVGAIIIGILLLGSFTLPYITGYNIKTPQSDLGLLGPKLFNAGTGWWDGTEARKNIAWDNSVENPDGTHGAPANTNMHAVVPGSLKIQEASYIDTYFAYAAGGYIRITTDSYCPNEPEEKDLEFFVNYTAFDFSDADNLELDIEWGDVDDIAGAKLGSYRVMLEYTANSALQTQYLGDWSKDYSENYKVNLSNAIAEKGFTSASKCKVYVELLPNVSATQYSYFLIKSLHLNSESTDEEHVALLNHISFDDANYVAGKGKGVKAEENYDYWQSTGIKNVYHAEQRIVSFRYDKYADILGHRYGFTVGQSIFKQYIKNGWCEFTDFSDISTFKVLDEEKCPVLEIYSGEWSDEYQVWQYKTHTIYYKYLGMDKMPIYLFGTTASGYDLLTLGMSCLKTSLLIAIISSVVCLAIGLVWGSVSGYFGGSVDLIMERITDIISGVPWIVMMTLIILLLGNNAVTFAIALIMTGWIGTATRTRMQFYRFKGREYVLASRTLGASDARLIFRHILPNGLGTIVTGSVLMIPSCIFSEATISYLGLGLKGLDSFGVLLSSNQQYLNSNSNLVVFPAIVISLLMISFNLFGNGLRDALNPTLKGGEQ